VLALLTRLFGEATFTDVEEPHGLLTVTTTRERIHDIIAGLQQDQEIKLNFLTTMCGINYPENEGQELGMIYHLHSLTQNIRLRIKIFFPIADPVVPTLTNLYATANWMEREAYDFFGVIFTGHPNLIRIPQRRGHGLLSHAERIPARGWYSRRQNRPVFRPLGP
jgi:NADH-quinone oxidoreductase subunit C